MHTSRPYAVNGLAANPWSPVIALTGQKQVLLYSTTNLDLLGVLPFPDGQPQDLRFSRSGKLLLASGGHAAKSGKVVVWDIQTGEPVATLGREYDAVLSADLRPDQTKVALGGPDRLLKVYGLGSGELEHKIKKHTDWVTAVAYSPNGEMLASADRNGGITVWDADNCQELFTTAGHKGAVSALSWRSDSKLLASASEDGTVKLWETSEGKQAKTWNAHPGGALCVVYGRDGRLLSSGRDGQVVIWNAEGAKAKTFAFTGEMALRCAWTHDQSRVVAGDFGGRVQAWNTQDAKTVGEFDSNPPKLSERIASARRRLQDLEEKPKEEWPQFRNVRQELDKAAQEARAAKLAADAAATNFAAKAQVVVRLKEVAAGANPPADIQERLASARAEREAVRTKNTDAAKAYEVAQQAAAALEEKWAKLRSGTDPETEKAAARASLERLLQAEKQSRAKPVQSANSR